MIKFDNLNIAEKIWLPFSAFLLLMFSALFFYYPNKQKEVFEQKKQSEMNELVQTIALGVELSLNNDDFQGLKKTLDFVEDRTDFEYVAILTNEHDTHKVFLNYPENFDKSKILNPKLQDFIVMDKPFQSEVFNGTIRLGVSKKQIVQQIKLLNSPVYIILFLGLITSLILFFYLARFISKPVLFVTHVARELESGNFEIEISQRTGKDEVSLLNSSLISLRDKLKLEKERNESLTIGLEQKIEARTAQLIKTTSTLEQAQRVSKLGSFSLDILTKELEGSESFFEITGLSNQMKSYSWVKRLRPDLCRDIVRFYEDPNNLIAIYNSDSKILVNNIEKWITVTCKLTSNDQSEPLRIDGTIQDITDRKNAEFEIRKLSLVAEKTSNSIIITDVNKSIVWCNEALTKLTGYTSEEVIGQTPKMFQFEKTNPETVQYINAKIEQNLPVVTEILNRGKNGNEYWLEISIVPLFNEEKQLQGYVAVETDITLRKESELKIQKSEENYRKILDNSAELIHTLDAEGNVVWANNAWLENMELSAEKVKGRNITEFLSSQTLIEFAEVMPKLARGEVVSNLDCQFISAQQKEVFLIGKTLPLFENGEFVGSQAYLRNITEAVIAERKLAIFRSFQNFLMQLSTEFLSISEDSFGSKLKESLKKINELTDTLASAIYVRVDENKFKLKSYSLNDSNNNNTVFLDYCDWSLFEGVNAFGTIKDKSFFAEPNSHLSLSRSSLVVELKSTDSQIGYLVLVMDHQLVLEENFFDLIRLYSQIITNTIDRLSYLHQLITSKKEIEKINQTLEQKVLENTRKNIELSRTLVDQEKLATIGEISAGIAHDLNTPLGAIKVGVESIEFSLAQFLKEDLSIFSSTDLLKILELARSKAPTSFYGGLALRKNGQVLAEVIQRNYDLQEEQVVFLAEGLSKCHILPDEGEIIELFVNMSNRLEALKILYHMQTIQSMTSTIQASIQKSIQVIQDIKSFSRNDFHDVKKPVNLKNNISTVLNVLKYELAKNVDLEFHLDNELVILGYEIKLFQLWSNLIKNAIDAMDGQEEKEIIIIANDSESHISVTVKNNGPMIPLNIQDKIFRKFFTSKIKKNGTGLGLSIVQNVVDDHNAQISLDSNDEYTSFTVLFRKNSE